MATKMKKEEVASKNVIGLRRNKVFLPANDVRAGEVMAMSVVSELMQFGFLPDESAMKMMADTSRAELAKFHDETITYLKEITGAKHNYKAFWDGFPEQVMEMDEYSLWFHQIVHYISEGSYVPSDWTKARPTAFEQPSYTVYKAGTDDEFLNIFTDLVSVNQSLTPQDLREVKWFARNVPAAELRMPKSIPFKETLTTLAALEVKVPVKSVTDVLRIAVAMSDGDTSLPKVPNKMKKASAWSKELVANDERDKFKFRKFSRAERRYIFDLLESTPANAEEAVLKDGRWVRLGEILHPGEYIRKYPKSAAMFDKIRNENVKSWYSKLQDAFKVSFDDGMAFLAKRPGEFFRRLDWMIRTNPNKQGAILATMESVAMKVSNKVLFENWTHFENRTKPVMNRSIMTKGARKRTKLPDLPAISPKVVSDIKDSIKRVLGAKFAALPALGDTWIDPELKNVPVPTNMRSMSDALKPTIRGQRTPIGNQNAKVVRAYVHWFDETGSEDIDLSATLIGMGKSTLVGWNGHHNHSADKENISCYSGDVRCVKGACAEYIDINFANAVKAGYKYAIIDARNYRGRGFDTMKDCAFGYMEREDAKANQKFKPDTLANAIRLQTTSTTVIVAVLDLETREYIFLDIDQDGIPVASANFDAIMEAIKPYCEPPNFSVYDLLEMHVNARGRLVADENSATTKFEYAPFAESYVQTLKMMQV